MKIKVKSKRVNRKRGEHRFSQPTNGIPRCVTCGCDEDDAFVGGQECSYKQKENWKPE
jgi:hypothetical protein